MSTKKVSYVKLLKEAISDFDTTKTVDVKGPMTDSILSYRGEGDLPTHKDAASILERYYFKENHDDGISIPNLDEAEGPAKPAGGAADPIDNPIDEVPSDNISKTKKEIEKAVAEAELSGQANSMAQDAGSNDAELDLVDADELKATKKGEKDLEVETEGVDSVENAIIEKLIEEMEEEIIDENAEGKATKGAGTEAAGAGDAEKEIPDRKDGVEVKGDTKLEQEILNDLMEDDNKGLGPIDPEAESQDQVEEAFAIFREQIEAESD
jgi:hypothetical protein